MSEESMAAYEALMVDAARNGFDSAADTIITFLGLITTEGAARLKGRIEEHLLEREKFHHLTGQ